MYSSEAVLKQIVSIFYKFGCLGLICIDLKRLFGVFALKNVKIMQVLLFVKTTICNYFCLQLVTINPPTSPCTLNGFPLLYRKKLRKAQISQYKSLYGLFPRPCHSCCSTFSPLFSFSFCKNYSSQT